MESEESTSTQPKLSDWSFHDDQPMKMRSPSNLSNRSDEIHPNNITTIVLSDEKKQEADDEHTYDDLYERYLIYHMHCVHLSSLPSRAGFFGKCCQCCPCSSTIIQGLIIGSIIGALALTIVLPILLIRQQNTSITTTSSK